MAVISLEWAWVRVCPAPGDSGRPRSPGAAGPGLARQYRHGRSPQGLPLDGHHGGLPGSTSATVSSPRFMEEQPRAYALSGYRAEAEHPAQWYLLRMEGDLWEQRVRTWAGTPAPVVGTIADRLDLTPSSLACSADDAGRCVMTMLSSTRGAWRRARRRGSTKPAKSFARRHRPWSDDTSGCSRELSPVRARARIDKSPAPLVPTGCSTR